MGARLPFATFRIFMMAQSIKNHLAPVEPYPSRAPVFKTVISGETAKRFRCFQIEVRLTLRTVKRAEFQRARQALRGQCFGSRWEA